eukprot:1884987-Pyramimonas_sp.AAC.1
MALSTVLHLASSVHPSPLHWAGGPRVRSVSAVLLRSCSHWRLMQGGRCVLALGASPLPSGYPGEVRATLSG